MLSKLQHAGGKMGICAAVERDDGIIGERIAQGAQHHLRPERRPLSLRNTGQQRIPVAHVLLRLEEELAGLLLLQQRQQGSQRSAYIAYETDFHRIAQTDMRALEVD